MAEATTPPRGAQRKRAWIPLGVMPGSVDPSLRRNVITQLRFAAANVGERPLTVAGKVGQHNREILNIDHVVIVEVAVRVIHARFGVI